MVYFLNKIDKLTKNIPIIEIKDRTCTRRKIMNLLTILIWLISTKIQGVYRINHFNLANELKI